ncbi:MAG: hypothetical protein Q9M32_01015 [Sulfurimonas sp.]|nr:hypothetical protein [Sulfurimonas sp.]MDQ7059777.1 hypothetical protein [Sulfurimonas sp.]
MKDDLEKITAFIDKHHVLSLATHTQEDLSVCSLFYVYVKSINSFIVASSDETLHIKHIKQNNCVAGNILLETKTVSQIQGVQFRASISHLENTFTKEFYFQAFPDAREMNPKLWQIKVNYFKMTDNALGFGNKIIWQGSSL